MPEKRQLAAIMFTDIVGYTALMGESEQKAYQLLKINRQLQKPLIKKYGGKWLKEMGDGVLASFQSVASAVCCAIEIQEKCQQEPDLKLKIGIHQGEVIFDKNDVFGDGVNIASRLESFAPAAGIYISESVFRNIENKEGIKALFVREEALKNVKYPIKIYEVNVNESKVIIQDNVNLVPPREYLKLPSPWLRKATFIVIAVCSILISFLIYRNLSSVENDKPGKQDNFQDQSIAVLSFDDFSHEGNQAWLSEGVMDAISSSLLSIENLRIIARSTMMQYKDSDKSISDIADELQVSYFLQGSVMSYEENIRINVQLIDTDDFTQIWSRSFDQEMVTVFDIYDDVAFHVARELEYKLNPQLVNIHSAEKTDNMEAYELYLQARSSTEWGAESSVFKESLEKAISLDSTFVAPYVWLGLYWMSQSSWNASQNQNYLESANKARGYLEYAITMNEDYGDAYVLMGELKFLIDFDTEEAIRLISKGYNLNPSTDNKLNMVNMVLPAIGEFEHAYILAKQAIIEAPDNPGAWAGKGLVEFFLGDHVKALETLEDGMIRFSEGNLINTAARVNFGIGDYQRVVDILESFLNNNPGLRPARSLGYLAVAYYKIGELERFGELVSELEQQAASSPMGSPCFHLSFIHAQMGKPDVAFKWLDKAYSDREIEMFWLKVEPPFEPIRDDPRFKKMVDQIGIPN